MFNEWQVAPTKHPVRDINFHRQSVSAGKTNAIPTEPSGRLRSVDHGSWLSCIGTGMRAFSSAQGPGLSSKCSAEVLDRQLVSAVLRSSVG